MGSGEGDAIRAMWVCLECNTSIPIIDDIEAGIEHAKTHDKEDDPAAVTEY